MSDEMYIGSIIPTALPFAPKYTAFCAGQILSIAQNQALFSLLSNTYGGNGTTNFALPDLRGRMPLGWGSSVDGAWQPGTFALGQSGGAEQVTLTVNQIPAHGHGDLMASGRQGTTTSPAGAYLAAGDLLRFAPGPDTGSAIIGNAGGSQPHENRQPSLTLNWVICLSGIYPSRS